MYRKIIVTCLALQLFSLESTAATSLLGCLDCFNFVAPSVIGAENISPAEVGLIVFDQNIQAFTGFNGTSWNRLGAGGSVPTGSILPFAGKTAPEGYILCDGQEYPASTHVNLASVLWDPATNRYSFGGTGTFPAGSFKAPDFRGRFLRGADEGTGRDPDATGRSAMAANGNTGNTIGSIQADAFQGHRHSFNSWAINQGGGNNVMWSIYPNTNTISPVEDPITDGVHGTPRTASETRPVNASVNYIIKL